ncbi:MAG TPA: RNA polymerase sigma factor [Thermoanaerobaculia bacterium]|jgi:RNA polymerase sigma-70 factor (ECF subfamily)
MSRRDDSDDEMTTSPQERREDAPRRPHLAYSASEHRQRLAEATDRELLRSLREDDEAALDELISRKTAPLLQTVYRVLGDAEEARDIVQVTFFRMWENRDRFDERWSPNTWIYRIATNLAIDQLRARQSRHRYQEPYRLHLQDAADSQSRRDLAGLGEGEVMGIFQELAAELTDKQRTVFLLREIEGLPSKEVAQIAGCRESTVRNHLFNARRILRQALLERYPEYAAQSTGETP